MKSLVWLADKDDAQYFISMLKAELAEPFSERINHMLNNPLVINNITVNKGVNAVYEKDIMVEINSTGNPTLYRIGETEDLSTAVWMPYQSSISYSLTSAYGSKTLYVQIGDGKYVSNTASKVITYSNMPTKGTISRDAAKVYREKYNGHKVLVNETIRAKK